MALRVLVGGMNHESNSLNPILSGEGEFRVFRGDEVFTAAARPGSSITGIVETLREGGVEIVPTLAARAVPNGVARADFYQGLKAEFLERAQAAIAAGPVDGVCLALHGSMKVEGGLCAEGDLCGALARLFPGGRPPVTAALDMHATITPDLLAAVDAFAGYKTAPHVDCEETGALAARALLDALRTGTRPRTFSQRVPLMVAGEKSETAAEPMISLIAACREAETRPGVLAASLLLGFPWADSEHNAATVLVSASGAASEAEAAAIEKKAADIAAEVWRRRRDFAFRVEHYGSREALDTAYRAAMVGPGPVFVSDSGDNPTAGATGDATDLFERVLETLQDADRLPTPLLYSGFFDEAAAAACVAAGEGAMIDIALGGVWDRVNGHRIPLRVRVERVVRGYGAHQADLALIAHRNLRVVVTSRHIGFGDGRLIPALGVDPADYCLVVVKLGYLEPCFRSIAKRAILAVSKGCSNEALETIPYRNVRRPIYPLDPDMEWTVSRG